MLPESSFAVQVTFVSPSGKRIPEGCEQVKGAGPQLSLAETPYWTTTPTPELAVTSTESGQVMTGFVVSTTVTEPSHQSLAAPSEAVSVTAWRPGPKDAEGDSERESGAGPLSGS